MSVSKNVLVPLVLLVSFATLAGAQFMPSYYPSGMQSMMNRMMQTGLSPASADCAALTTQNFEAFGDAWMERMIGDTAAHERMDASMGTEGTRLMHIMMGRSLTGCLNADNATAVGAMPMMMWMMPAMMNAYGGGAYSSASFQTQNWTFWLTILNTALLAALLFFVLARKGRR